MKFAVDYPIGSSVDDWTLLDVFDNGSLHIECARCWKMSQMELQPLIYRFGQDATLKTIVEHCTCRRCGGREARALVRLYGWRGDKAWRPYEPLEGR